MIDKVRTLNGPWAPLVSLSFHLRSTFTPLFTFLRLLPDAKDSVLLAFGSYPWVCENVARAACTLWSRGSWLGALVSALCICCFLAHRLLYGTLWFVVSLLFCIAIPIPEVIQCYHPLLAFSNCPWTDQLTTGRAGFCFCSGCVVCFFVFLSVLFVFVFLVFAFCLARWLNGLCFVSHCHYDQCCYCINSVNLHNAIVFPAW